MCCIFTCCGWMIDLVQRLWTFTMSCCISSAVCCVMLTSSMSGIALGYNYSLAEYIDLKETNVSIYLKRGVFDDEIADDMDWRRSGRMPVAGHIKSDNLMTGEKEEDSLGTRSGRRLDDSVFEADDQNKYEGSLMKLTARPQVLPPNSPVPVTDDVEMGDTFNKYTRGSLDHMKAIQSLIDARRAMGTTGTTASPLATYNVNNQNFPMYLDANLPSGRRMMAYGPGLKPGDVHQARKGVPNEAIADPKNWIAPKRPDLYRKFQAPPDYDNLSPTYPPPITLNLGPIRTQKTTTYMEMRPISFVTRTTGADIPEQPTRPRIIEKFDKDTAMFNEKFLLEGEPPSKSDFKNMMKGGSGSKSSEEEYEDEIKGLPVRRRRSIVGKPLAVNSEVSSELNVTDIETKDNASSIAERLPINSTTVEKMNSSKEVVTTLPVGEDLHKADTASITNTNHERNFDANKSTTSVETSELIISTDVSKPDLDHTEKATSDKPPDEKKNEDSNTLLNRLITATKAKLSSLTQDATQKTNSVSDKNIKIVTRKKPFERIIVSSKYVTNKPTKELDKATTISTQELLNSISISLGEAGLLRNPSSSSFVKLLQSTLT